MNNPDDMSSVDPLIARQIAMQFCGQQMGEMKDLNSRIVSSNSTMQPVKVDIKAVVDSVPIFRGPPVQQTPVHQSMSQPAPSLPQQIVHVPMAPPQVLPPVVSRDSNQLELIFDYNAAQDVIKRLERIEALVKRIAETMPQPKQKKS